MKKFLFSLLVLSLLAPCRALADEGMWLPSLIKNRIPDMQAKGFKLTAEDLYSTKNASLKDAIVLFGRGCTGELISPQGLLVTNHHCGYGQIQSHSTVEHDYLTNGFWAMNRAEELPNPGLTVSFLVRMEDVTSKVLQGTSKLGEPQRSERIAQNIDKIKQKAVRGTHYTAAVEPFYYGNQYFLFVSEVFTDVRLVGAPPSSIGKFGGDTDNWMWPRHTGDFSLFRIYAGTDNKPADYSPDNVPYVPKKYFEISTEGVQEGDFTMVYGFPGSTQQFLTSDAVDYVLNYSNPVKIDLRTRRLDIINAAQQADPAVRIAYAAKAAGIANAWKKWQGESLGLERLGTIQKKRVFEEQFNQWADSRSQYKDVLEQLGENYRQMLPFAMARDYYTETAGAIELVNAAILFNQSYVEGQSMPESLVNFYRDYYPEIDRRIALEVLEKYIENMDMRFIPYQIIEGIDLHGSLQGYVDWLFENSVFTNGLRVSWLYDSVPAVLDVMDDDPASVLARQFLEVYRMEIIPNLMDHMVAINDLYRTYVRGRMEMEPKRAYFPDANLTLRIAYGNVEGYVPRDGEIHLPVSTIEGIMQKDDPNVYDYDIPQRLRDIYASGDYGRWDVDGTVPVCFLATNHTTGGNSGSPVLNAEGRLVGINFDRTWLSTMSDIEFDPLMCRNIALDVRYMLFVMDKVAGAGYLFDEMRIR